MERSIGDARLLGGLLVVALLAILGGQTRFLRVRRALGLEQLLASSFLFLPLGMLLSEAGLGVISQGVVREFEALVTLGLGVLGLLFGLRVDAQSFDLREQRLLRAASIESVFTLVLVGVPVFFLLEVVLPDSTGTRAAAAALLGCTAAISGGQSFVAASARGDTTDPGGGHTIARIADYGTLFGVLAAGILLALLAPGPLGRLERLVAIAAIGCVGGLGAWLLANETKDTAVRTALLMGVVLATAGTAAHLSLPPVAATLVSGITIAHLPGTLAKELRKSLAFLEAPFTALLVVIAGTALRVPTTFGLAILVIALVLRTAGKILGGRVAARVSGGVLPARMGLGLLPSSAIALGLALDFNTAMGEQLSDVVITTGILGALLSETAGVWTTRLLARAVALTNGAQEASETTPAPHVEPAEQEASR